MATSAKILTPEETRKEAKVIQDFSMLAVPLIHPHKGKNDTKRKIKVKTIGRIVTQSLSLSFSKVALSANIVYSVTVDHAWKISKKKQRPEHSALIGVPLIPFFSP